MGHGLGKEMKPYRVEWRAHLDTRWLLMREYDTHDEAMAGLEEFWKARPGQTRVVVQHVIEVRGLGA